MVAFVRTNIVDISKKQQPMLTLYQKNIVCYSGTFIRKELVVYYGVALYILFCTDFYKRLFVFVLNFFNMRKVRNIANANLKIYNDGLVT